MPSAVSLVASLVTFIVTAISSTPLLFLQRTLVQYGGAPALVKAVQALRVPSTKLVQWVLYLGIAIRAAYLLEGYGAEHVGLWINSLGSGSNKTAVSTLNSEVAASHLANLTTRLYPETLSMLLDDALALPKPLEGTTFSAADIQQWEDESRAFREDYDRLSREAATLWLDLLDYTPTSLRPDAPSTPADRYVFLHLLFDELNAVQAGSPLRAVYSAHEYAPADFARDEARRLERAQAEAARLDGEFAEWLDGVLSAGEEQEAESGEVPSLQREMLDLPVNPDEPEGQTWRGMLREGWEKMYDPAQGGVMGNLARSLRQIGEDFGEADDNEEDEAEKGMPQPLPLMVNHHLRAQLSTALTSARAHAGSLRGADRFVHDADDEDARFPRMLRSLPDENLSITQRAVKIDIVAREWAGAVVDWITAASAKSSAAPAVPIFNLTESLGALSVPDRAALLRASPLPSFLRTLDPLLGLPMSRLRLGVSKHNIANAVFSLSIPAIERSRAFERGLSAAEREKKVQQQQSKGCSRVLLEIEWRAASEETRARARELIAAEQEQRRDAAREEDEPQQRVHEEL
ncbi:uncharacterized protein JCM10292_004972 [Rhodotorula paludigena]|uniref:uncharacterized protein n=1 Tax=Rhodotorula paludigena TaxID=86838 RepID=UPI003181501F